MSRPVTKYTFFQESTQSSAPSKWAKYVTQQSEAEPNEESDMEVDSYGRPLLDINSLDASQLQMLRDQISPPQVS